MHREPVKFLILIDAGGAMVARLLDANRGHVMDIDASTEEVVATINGAVPIHNGTASEWDQALAGHSTIERAQAQVYTLPI